jgi:hypothetical protein
VFPSSREGKGSASSPLALPLPLPPFAALLHRQGQFRPVPRCPWLAAQVSPCLHPSCRDPFVCCSLGNRSNLLTAPPWLQPIAPGDRFPAFLAGLLAVGRVDTGSLPRLPALAVLFRRPLLTVRSQGGLA